MKYFVFLQGLTSSSKRSLIRSALALIAGLMLLVPLPASAQLTLTFGTYAADKPTETVRKYGPFLAFLSRELSEELDYPVTIRMKIDKEYDAAIENLASGAVDFARFGPASYVAAKQKNPDISILAMESKKGKKRFNGVIAVHADSTFQTLGDLRGHTFAFGDELSTIGRYLSQSQLLDAGISAGDLAEFAYLGRHDIVGEAVGSEKFTAGALKESTFKKLVKKGVPIRALVKFDNVTKPWLGSSRLPGDIAEALTRAMLDESNLEQVQKVAKHGFLPGSDQDYDFVRRAIEHSMSF